MTTFCLLHGKWHDGSCWEPLVAELEQRGHTCLTPDLPMDDPPATHEQRAQPALDAMAGEPAVVIVGHSLGAGLAPIVAVRGGAAHLVYLCPAPTGPFGRVDVGTRAIREGFPFPPDREDRTSVWEPDAAVAAMYPRLESDTARALAARLRPGATPPDRYSLDGHPAVATMLVAATYDEFFEADWSRRVATTVLGAEATEIATGHFPMAEAPAELTRVLERCVGVSPSG